MNVASPKRDSPLERRQTRAVNKKGSSSKDEMLLFGQNSDGGCYEKSEGANTKQTVNPLLARNRKEAQTEIVDHKIDEDMQNKKNGTSRSVYENDSEDDKAEQYMD